MWDITQNIKGTENQRSDVKIIGFEQPVSPFARGSVSLSDLCIIINTKRGTKIVRIKSESL